MAITFLEIDDQYMIKDQNESVSVFVEIGDAQTGAYLIFLDKNLQGANGNISLGKAADIVGKRCIVSTTIVDEREETNLTSVTVFVKEGTEVSKYGPYKKEVAAHLDAICYVVTLQILN
jgi:hypothetical protein